MIIRSFFLVAVGVVTLSASAFADSSTVGEELKQFYRLNETDKRQCDNTVLAVVKTAKEFLAQEASAGRTENTQVTDTIHTIEALCESRKNS